MRGHTSPGLRTCMGTGRGQEETWETEKNVQCTKSSSLAYKSVWPKFSATLLRKRNKNDNVDHCYVFNTNHSRWFTHFCDYTTKDVTSSFFPHSTFHLSMQPNLLRGLSYQLTFDGHQIPIFRLPFYTRDAFNYLPVISKEMSNRNFKPDITTSVNLWPFKFAPPPELPTSVTGTTGHWVFGK